MVRRAVIIGSNGPVTNSLKFAEDDAQKIACALKTPKCGFEVDLIIDAKSRGAVMDKMGEIIDSCDKSDTLMLYFSGHGVIRAGGLFLLLATSADRKFSTTTLSAREIMNLLTTCAARQKLLVLDCCNAGTLAGAVGLRGESVPAEAIGIAPQGHEGHYVLMASGHLEPARELQQLGGSFLTHYMCSALEEHFSDADRDGDRTLSLVDLTGWLEERAEKHNRCHKELAVPIPRTLA
jgi:uncharacterized caspase-like protein